MFVRWNNLSMDEEERTRLPGYRDEAVVRHFEAPGAIKTRFYEVRAKSILNRVPEASRMPFRWTINAYRGCTHACEFCLWGGTPVLTADGRHKPIEAIEVGDEIYGTADGSKYRKYARTVVLDKWITIKPAYRLVLEDGTELITSGDHRFLSNRGWRHVLNSTRSEPDRPHLTTRNSLVGTGGFAEQPVENRDYRQGYLCGILRGDGHVGSYSHVRPGRNGDVHRFRLALTDIEALRRARDYLAAEVIATSERVFSAAAGSHRVVRQIGACSRRLVERAAALVQWPARPSLDWRRGFLAGIFDAEGSRSDFALRISNKDPEILGWIDRCAKRLGFDVVAEPSRPNGLGVMRIRGGLSEHLRFFHLTDPAITRKRTIEGEMVKTFANLKVSAIEPLGRALPLYDITTGTGDFIANGVVSHNCFARPTHTYLGFNAAEDFEREIVVKVNAPELLRAELTRPSWEGEHVALGTNTDPYQWVEGRYKLMRGIWEAMRDAGNPCSVLTKSPLLLRDLDLFKQIDQRTEFSAALSVPTLDEKAWRSTEPHTPNPRARLEAVAELAQAGIRTGVLVAPLMPGVNDDPDQVRPILEMAAEAGAAYVSGIALHLRGEVRQLWFDWLEEHRPDLVERYRELYRRGAYAPAAERRRLSELVSAGFSARAAKRPTVGHESRTIFERGGRVDPAAATGHSAASRHNDHTPFSPAQGRLF
ncbi:MAG TPA: LAGLIDADG family homing endonuclease [Solirubrobacteraceae bacterium]|nr:LAGLIDADG family homing endonuclease [Solirubrobacteraceae bacterium]